jgi:aspartyl-tRNA(Asn)/glutamyl-tRNA(Gln) amidotransferase subunit C
MSDISAEQVRHLANLARIDLSDAEIATMTTELGQIMEAVASVQNVYRADVVADVIPTDKALASAPEHDGSRFKVSAILGEEQ